ncbi:MAG: putative lipid II flippase FtsW [Ruminococcus sp.]|nr:putative lipid II flippase FtsW [Ruminococcus sp.]
MPERPSSKKPPSKRKKAKKEKPKWLPNNKSPLKYLIPKSSGTMYLNEVRIGEMDLPFLFLVIVLLVFGLVIMYSASYAWAIHDGVSQYYYFIRQCQMAGIGLVLMIFLASPLFDYHVMKNPLITYGAFIASIVLMLLVFTSLGVSSSDADRWIEIGPIQFQPSELVKLTMVMVFAYMMSANYKNMQTVKYGIVPYLLIMGIILAITVAQRHLSATIIIACIGIALIFIGGARLDHFIILVLLLLAVGGAGLYLLQFTGKFDYVFTRVEWWLDPFADEYRDAAWQTRNSLIAIGSGGVFGLGLGNSRQKFLYLPEAKNDFVFAIVCEELGFVGASLVIILFLVLIFRGFAIAQNAPDKYGMLLAAGIMVQVGLQALLNIAVVTNAIPNTGISLPFFSYGGTALILQLVEMGVVLNISRQSIPGKGRDDTPSDDKELEEIYNAKKKLRG